LAQASLAQRRQSLKKYVETDRVDVTASEMQEQKLPMIGRSGSQSIDSDVEEVESDEGEVEDGEDDPYKQYKVGFLVAVVALFLLQVGTKDLTSQLLEGPHVPAASPALSWFFNTGLVGSVILFLCVPLQMYGTQSKILTARTTAILALWMFVFIAIGFALMVKGFADTCTYYNANRSPVPLPGDADFMHAECADHIHVFRLLKTKPEVAGAILGACFAIFSGLAISTMGMLVEWLRDRPMARAENSKFGWSLSAICVDLMDWQDFTLTLIDGDVLEGAQEVGASRTWRSIVACCAVSFLAITCMLVYEFTYSMQKIDDEEGEVVDKLVDKGPAQAAEEKDFSPAERYCVWASLLFIEIPFLAYRAYVTWCFGAIPSSLILKNLVSVPKEIFELMHNKAISNAVTQSAGAD